MNGWHRTRMLLVLVLLLGTLSAEAVRARQTPSSLPGATPPTSTGPGEITVQILACPAGMRPLDLEPTACSPNATAIALLLGAASAAGNRPHPVPAPHDDAVLTWSGVPFGTYILKAKEFAPGYDRYFIPGRTGLNIPPDLGYTSGPNEGYLLPLDAEHPRYDLDVYVFRAFAVTGTVRLGVRLWQCPAGITAAPEMRDLNCVALDVAPPNFAFKSAAEVENSGSIRHQAVMTGSWRGWLSHEANIVITARLAADVNEYAVRAHGSGIRLQVLSDRSGVCPRPGARNRNAATGDRGGRDRCLPLALRVNHTATGPFFVFEPASALERQPAEGAAPRGQAPHPRRWYLPTTAVLRPVGASH